jgi:hypothetical protein
MGDGELSVVPKVTRRRGTKMNNSGHNGEGHNQEIFPRVPARVDPFLALRDNELFLWNVGHCPVNYTCNYLKKWLHRLKTRLL